MLRNHRLQDSVVPLPGAAVGQDLIGRPPALDDPLEVSDHVSQMGPLGGIGRIAVVDIDPGFLDLSRVGIAGEPERLVMVHLRDGLGQLTNQLPLFDLPLAEIALGFRIQSGGGFGRSLGLAIMLAGDVGGGRRRRHLVAALDDHGSRQHQRVKCRKELVFGKRRKPNQLGNVGGGLQPAQQESLRRVELDVLDHLLEVR